MSILKVGDIGSYEDLSRRKNPDQLVIAYNPPIGAMLERAKQLYQREPTESEIARIKAGAQAIAVPQDVYEATYRDRNSENI